MNDFTELAQVVGLVSVVLGGGIALGKAFSDVAALRRDNTTLKKRMDEMDDFLYQQSNILSALQVKMTMMLEETTRMRNRLDELMSHWRRSGGSGPQQEHKQ